MNYLWTSHNIEKSYKHKAEQKEPDIKQYILHIYIHFDTTSENY